MTTTALVAVDGPDGWAWAAAIPAVAAVDPLTRTAATTARVAQDVPREPSVCRKVNLIDATIKYERFTSDGTPIRAEVTIKLNARFLPPVRTNPSSGGIPGRSSHTLVTGENLQHIAMANYGRPGAWRALAAANGIENPLAVRPGMVIYVPAAGELADGSPQ